MIWGVKGRIATRASLVVCRKREFGVDTTRAAALYDFNGWLLFDFQRECWKESENERRQIELEVSGL